MISFGERAGEFVRKLKEEESFDMPSRHKRPLLTKLVGFTLHADRRIKRRDRNSLKALIRYMARPSVMEKDLSYENNEIKLKLKTPWKDGTDHLLFSPMEFIERLCALIPRPYKNLIVYSGFMAPNSKIRKKVLLKYKPKSKGKWLAKSRLSYQELLKRSFLEDRSKCNCCGGALVVTKIVVPIVHEPP